MTYAWLVAAAVVVAIGWTGRAVMLHMRIKELPTVLQGTKSADRAEIIRALLGRS